MPLWWNWQTRNSQKVVLRRPGSNPGSGTVCVLFVFCVLFSFLFFSDITICQKHQKETNMKKICVLCKNEFDVQFKLDEVISYQPKRTRCYDCVPYEVKNKDNKRLCKICKEYKENSEFSQNSKSGYLHSYCKPCVVKKSKEPRRKFKQKCIEYKGGKCISCGYNKCQAALEFHHRNPKEKDFSLRDIPGKTVLTDKVKKELDKCDLLCSNCHKEKHFLGEIK